MLPSSADPWCSLLFQPSQAKPTVRNTVAMRIEGGDGDTGSVARSEFARQMVGSRPMRLMHGR